MRTWDTGTPAVLATAERKECADQEEMAEEERGGWIATETPTVVRGEGEGVVDNVGVYDELTLGDGVVETVVLDEDPVEKLLVSVGVGVDVTLGEAPDEGLLVLLGTGVGVTPSDGEGVTVTGGYGQLLPQPVQLAVGTILLKYSTVPLP